MNNPVNAHEQKRRPSANPEVEMSKLLIVDDEIEAVELLRDFLSRKGYDVRAATSGEEAVRLGRQYGPDLVIVDYLLQDFCGTDVVRSLRAHWPKLEAIIMTGLAPEEVQENAEDIDRLHVRMKPVALKEMLDLANSLCTST